MTKKQLDNLSFILSMFGIVSLVIFGIGLMNIENYINWFLFTIVSIIFGIISALIIHKLICSFEPKIKTYKNTKGFKIFHLLVFSTVMISFGFLRFVNEYKIKQTDCKSYKIVELGKSGSKNPTYYVFINGKNGEERLSFGKSFYKKHKVGDSINLCIHTGILGFKYYKTIKTPPNRA